MSQNTDIYKEYLEELSPEDIAEIVETGRHSSESSVSEEDVGSSGKKDESKSKKRKKTGKTMGEKPKLTEKQKTTRALRRLLTKVIVVAVAAVLLFTLVLGVTVYHDNAMYPHIKDGDLVIYFRMGSSYNGDIVMYEVGEEKRLGRVVGIPGDTIDFNTNGTYTINGTVPYESVYYKTSQAPGSQVVYPYQVREGEYFVFNDMREDQKDSRIYGGITDVKGKVVLVVRRRGF